MRGMNDTFYFLLTGVIGVLTIILAIIGIQVVYILRECRRTIEKINKILSDMGRASEKVSNSLSEVMGITSGIKTILKVFNLFSKGRKKKEKEHE